MSPVTENISAAQVKELCEKTGAPMMDCRNALQEAKGDLDQAVVVLRKRGMASAAKKASPACRPAVSPGPTNAFQPVAVMARSMKPAVGGS